MYLENQLVGIRKINTHLSDFSEGVKDNENTTGEGLLVAVAVKMQK